ncbi:hypothetical protein ABMA27_009062 [Loxostege sticticalis]|uniref:Gustatory receptor n=1 Tax=Loxostege sticticalis TaxID=481309 RepID=A0ABR3HA66_LOXSC
MVYGPNFQIIGGILFLRNSLFLQIDSFYNFIRFDKILLPEYIADFLTRGLYCLQDFTLLFVPAVSAGILTYQAQQLLLMLHDRLLQERSEDHADDIELFIDYVEARPLALTVFEVIRLDWSLPVLVLNLCITYQIVVVQLTHIY